MNYELSDNLNSSHCVMNNIIYDTIVSMTSFSIEVLARKGVIVQI